MLVADDGTHVLDGREVTEAAREDELRAMVRQHVVGVLAVGQIELGLRLPDGYQSLGSPWAVPFLVREAEVVDAQRAVLIAAMACEIKVKRWMSANVGRDRAELLRLVLQRTSNLRSLLDAPLEAAVGTSLKSADRQLFKAVEHLTTLRNRIVHRGDDVEQPEAWRMVVTAQQLFRWLDEMQVPPTGSDAST